MVNGVEKGWHSLFVHLVFVVLKTWKPEISEGNFINLSLK